MSIVDSSASDAERHNAYMRWCRQHAVDASRRIMPIVFQLFEVRTVLDVGCGTGAWLAAAAELGAQRLTGVDARWAEDWLLASGMIGRTDFEFVCHDLRVPRPIDVTDRYDLAMSLEVAQHFPESRAQSFVHELCAAAPRVLFSSAIPLQYPPLEPIMINNQWQSYWAARFRSFDFLPCDVIRPLIWNDDHIADYYRQNMLLYVHRSDYDGVLRNAGERLGEPDLLLDMAHPSCWERRSLSALEPVGFRQSLRIARGIPREFVRAARRRFNTHR